MKKTYALASLLLLAPMVAQAQEEAKIESSGEMTVGVRQGDVDPDSSKFNEYRDIDDGFYLDNLEFGVLDPNNGRFLDFQGGNLLKDDQTIRFGFGNYGSWNVIIDRNETPHNLSNKARTPYIDQGNGLLTLPSTAPVVAPNLINATLANDTLTADWLDDTLHGIDLGTQRDKTGATVSLTPNQDFKFRLSLSDERKDGSNLTYGPIGDRPPRTLNAQLAEPIDYKTQELKFEAEYNQPTYQALFTYLLSGFENDIDTLRWQNPYNTAGSAYQTWESGATDYNVAGFGQRGLAPDNRYQNVSLALGIDLPMASRLSATIAYGMMEQDEALLPYSTSDFGSATAFGSVAELPRVNADTEIDTTMFNADYSINPIDRLNLRAFVRYYEMDNKTPQNNWWYVTDDTITTANAAAGETTELNKRVNLAYSYDQTNYGLETSYNLPFWRTTFGLGYEREDIDREFREANTEENIFKGSVKTKPTNWLTLRAKYLYGDRDGGDYNNTVTAQSYWGVNPASQENPANSFSNHPDMRISDVSDRERNQLDLAATVMPTEGLDLTASYRYRNDDYDSNVGPVQPLLASGLGEDAADDIAITPGNQLGLLESKTNRYALDASYAPTERLTLNAFGSRETIKSTQRGLEFDENRKLDPTDVAAATELGPWTRATSQWMATTKDRTNTIGVGAGYEIIPGTLRLVSDYTYSQGKVDIEYSGFGAQSSVTPSTALADTYQFAFRSPETVTHKQYNLNATLEYQFVKNLVCGVHYIYDRYKISDWMQETDTPWYESVGSEYLLRDSSDDNRWGNRLINLGSYLGPSYEAHFGAVTLTYRF